MAIHSGTLAWKIPRMEEPGGPQSMRSLRVRHDWATSLSLLCIGEGNGNPLQCSCLESPRDGGAWWAAVYGVTQSQTRLKRLSSSSIYKSASMGIVGSIYQRTQEKYHPLVHWVIVIHTSNSPNYRHYSGLWTRSSPSWPWSGSPGNSGLFYVIRHRWKGLSGCSEVQQKSFSTPLGQK